MSIQVKVDPVEEAVAKKLFGFCLLDPMEQGKAIRRAISVCRSAALEEAAQIVRRAAGRYPKNSARKSAVMCAADEIRAKEVTP